MVLLHVAFAGIRHRPFRSVLTVGGIALGAGAFVALVGFSQSFEEQWRRSYSSRSTDLVVLRGSLGSLFNKASTDEAVGETLRGIQGVGDVSPVAFDLIDFSAETSAMVQGWTAKSYEFDSLKILEGRALLAEEPAVLLGALLAENLGKRPGGTVEIMGSPVPIAGVFRAGDALTDSGAVMPLHQLQRLSEFGAKVSGFHVRLQAASGARPTEADLRRAQTAIEVRLPGFHALSVAEAVRNNRVTNFIRSTAWATSAMALLIAILGVANTMAMSVFERTREIGVLRAIGWRRSRIIRLILLEASLLGAAGGIVGLAAGRLGLAVLASIRMAGGLPAIRPTWIHMTEAVGIAWCISVAAGFLPAWRGARCAPVAALRHE